MKKSLIIFLYLFSFFSAKGQEKPVKEKAKDTVKTEVVNVVTKFNPKIADASKLKRKPKIELLNKSKKKKLEYTIFSAPVASTFIPKSGVVKGIDVGVKERIYKNYIAAGFGNYSSPYVEAFLHHSTRFKNEFGLSVKYSSSEDNVRNSVLNSNFSNFKAGIFYKQEDRYFDWKVTLNSERNKYNWYGLPELNFNSATINSINEKQTYNYFQLIGDIAFIDSYIDFGKISVSYFTDSYNSKEALINFKAKLDLPLDFLQLNLNDLAINTNFEFLRGEFKNNYINQNPLNYSLITAKIFPEYKVNFYNFFITTGAKLVFSLDTENSATNFLIYPEVSIKKSIIKNYLNAYGGVTGDLHTNTYKNFTEENPFVSPTLFITQTSEKLNYFFGLNGKINNDISFNIKANLKEEEDKPLFIRNNSKSDGTTTILNNIPLKGYEYGNSFGVFYDDIRTLSYFVELEYDFTRKITFGINAQKNSYEIKKHFEAWNLPEIKASLFGKYKSTKWYATTNVFYVSNRKTITYNSSFPSSISKHGNLDSFIDVKFKWWLSL